MTMAERKSREGRMMACPVIIDPLVSVTDPKTLTTSCGETPRVRGTLRCEWSALVAEVVEVAIA